MKTTFIIPIVLIILLPVSVQSQELHVYFDAYSKDVIYKKGDKITYKPKARKGEQIIFHLQNFNNFLYDAQVTGNSSKIHEAKSSGNLSMLSPSFSGSNGMFSGLIDIDGAANAGISASDKIEFGGLGYGANVEDANQLSELKQTYDSALKDMHSVEKQLRFINEDLDLYVEAQTVNKVITNELALLKMNPRLQPAQIKSLSIEYLQKIFGTNESSEITLSSLLEKSDSKSELRGFKSNLLKQEAKYEESIATVSDISSKLSLFKLINPDAKTLANSSTEVLTKSKKVLTTISENKSRLEQFIQEAQNQDVKQLASLRYEYESLSSSDFSETFRLEADGDFAMINVKLVPRDSLGKLNMLNSIEMPPLKIPVFGGLKINTSVGLSFGRFLEEQNTYFLKDSLIASQPKGKFTPMLTSFFHFYAQTRSEVTLGGSFGIGLPLNTENGQQSVSFFLGPSLIFGKGERMVLSAGIMGGRTNKLANGFQLGDSFASEIDNIPTYSAYDIGYFFGLSFNLISK